MKVYSFDSSLLELAEPFEISDTDEINAIIRKHDVAFHMDPDGPAYTVEHSMYKGIFVLMLSIDGWAANLFFCVGNDELAELVCKEWFECPEYMAKFTGEPSKSGF